MLCAVVVQKRLCVCVCCLKFEEILLPSFIILIIIRVVFGRSKKMKIYSPLIDQMHLDPTYALLSVQNIVTTRELFHALDVHKKKCINDVQFHFFMKHQSDLDKSEIQVIFKLLDVDKSAEIEFDEFYLIFCIMVACKDQYEKEFIYRHAASIFQLIDQDSSGHINSEEFANMGILFNFDKSSIMSIFNEFDISGDKNLDFGEFRLFTMACIDEQRGIEASKKVAAFRDYNHRLIDNLMPIIKRYMQTRTLPPPLEVEVAIDSTEPPFMLPTRYRKNCYKRILDCLSSFLFWFLSVLSCVSTCFKSCCKKLSHHQTSKKTLNCQRCRKFFDACRCGRNRNRRKIGVMPPVAKKEEEDKENEDDDAVTRMQKRRQTAEKMYLLCNANSIKLDELKTIIQRVDGPNTSFFVPRHRPTHYSVKKFD